MDKKSLEDKKLVVESSFNDLKERRDKLTNEISEIDVEIVKLQGEYRLITELIDNGKTGEKNAR